MYQSLTSSECHTLAFQKRFLWVPQLQQLAAADKAAQQGTVHPMWGQSPPATSQPPSPRPPSRHLSDVQMVDASAPRKHCSQSDPGNGIGKPAAEQRWVVNIPSGAPVPMHPGENGLGGWEEASHADAGASPMGETGSASHEPPTVPSASASERNTGPAQPQTQDATAVSQAASPAQSQASDDVDAAHARIDVRPAAAMPEVAEVAGQAGKSEMALAATLPEALVKEEPAARHAAAAESQPAPRSRQGGTTTGGSRPEFPEARFRRVMAEAARAQAQHGTGGISISSKPGTAEEGQMGQPKTSDPTQSGSGALPGVASQQLPGARAPAAGHAAASAAAMQMLLRKGGLLDQMRQEVGTAQQNLQASVLSVTG